MTATPSTLSHSDDEIADAVEASLLGSTVRSGGQLLGTFKRGEQGGFDRLVLHGCDEKLMKWARDIFREVSHFDGGSGYKCELELQDLGGGITCLHGAWVQDATPVSGRLILSFDNFTTEGM